MAKGVREGYSAVRALGLSVAPFALRVLFTWLPPAFAIYYWRRFFASKMADYVFGRHARAASRGDARTGGRLSHLAGKERCRGSCTPPALPCHRHLCGVDGSVRASASSNTRYGKLSEALQWASVSKTLHPGTGQTPVLLPLWSWQCKNSTTHSSFGSRFTRE